MPQGKVIAIKPLDSFSEDTAFTAETTTVNQELSQKTWDGEVEILNGAYEGRIGSFKQKGKYNETAEGAIVNIKIKEADKDKIKVTIVD